MTPPDASQSVEGTLGLQRIPRNYLVTVLFMQAWFLLLHFLLAQHTDPSVRVLGKAFDLTREGTVPSFWASIQALIVALAAFGIAWGLKGDFKQRILRTGWYAVGGLFTIIALDDAAGFHERVSAITAISWMDGIDYPSYPWHVILAPFLVIGLLASGWMFWKALGPMISGQIALGLAFLCYGGAFVIDFAEGLGAMAELTESSFETLTSTDKAVEEMLELVGTTLIAYVALMLFARRFDGLVIRVPTHEHQQADQHERLEEEETHAVGDRQMQPKREDERQSAALLEP